MKGKKLGIKLDDIVRLYEEGKNCFEIAEILGGTHSNIWRRLKKSGYTDIASRCIKRMPSRRNCHKIDLDFFENIDNQDKAYFLGVMFSDGSVTKNNFYLKMKDSDVVYKFKEALQCDYPITYKTDPYISYRLYVSSQKMCNDLIKLGCVPNKTRVLRFPNLRDDLIPHFIRGFFDGDGCLGLYKETYHTQLNFTSAALDFLYDLKEVIDKVSWHPGHIHKESKYEVWHLVYCGHQVQPLMKWLYKDAHYYMKRKHTAFEILSSLEMERIAGKSRSGQSAAESQNSVKVCERFRD